MGECSPVDVIVTCSLVDLCEDQASLVFPRYINMGEDLPILKIFPNNRVYFVVSFHIFFASISFVGILYVVK